jgi:hypothetical protein
VHAALWSTEVVDVPLRLIARHHTRKVRIRLDRLLDGSAGFEEVALRAKGIDLVGADPDLNDALIEPPAAPTAAPPRFCIPLKNGGGQRDDKKGVKSPVI